MEDVPRRKSRRIQGLVPQIDESPPKAVYLPPVLKFAVLARLDNWDLKNVRLVSKEWNALATRPLSDRVYVYLPGDICGGFLRILRGITLSARALGSLCMMAPSTKMT